MNLNELAYQLKEQGLSYIQIGFVLKEIQIAGKFDYFVDRTLKRRNKVRRVLDEKTRHLRMVSKKELYTLKSLIWLA